MDLTNLLMQYLSSEETYAMTKDIKFRILCGDKNHVKGVLQTLAKFISDPNEQPIVRLLALKFNKDLTETFQEEYIHLMQKIILPKLEIIALSTKESGRLLFLNDSKPNHLNKELQSTGKQFFSVILECMWVWSKWFPIDKNSYRLSNYRVTIEKLIKLGIKFPQLQYFDIHFVMRNIPLTLPPLPMIVQLRELLAQQPNLPTKQICHHLSVTPAISSYQTKYNTYGDMIQAVIKRSTMTRPKRKTIGTILLEEENKIKSQMLKSSEDPQAQMQAIYLEKQQLENSNSCYQAKNLELQKQLINAQNKIVLLQHEIETKNTLIIKLTTQFEAIGHKFQQLSEQYEKYSKIVHHTPYAQTQFEQEMKQFRTSYEFVQLEAEFEKAKDKEINLSERCGELESQLETIMREKISVLTLNQQLEQRITYLERKKFIRQGTRKDSYVDQDKNTKLNQIKSQLLQQEQIMIQQKAQISQLKEQLANQNKKNSLSSTSSTAQQKHQFQSQRELNITPRSSKPIGTPQVEYDYKLFAIHPNAFNLRFRQSCLTSKSILYSDDYMQIGILSQMKQKVLSIKLGILNKSDQDITQVQIVYHHFQQLQVFMQPSEIIEVIKPKEQASYKFSIQILHIPYNLQEIKLNYVINQQNKELDLCLPCTINKFFTFQDPPSTLPPQYFYNSKPFPTGFRNQLPLLLSEFTNITQTDNEFESVAKVELERKQFLISIQAKDQLMTVRINGDYQDKLAQFIISTYQGLFYKR